MSRRRKVDTRNHVYIIFYRDADGHGMIPFESIGPLDSVEKVFTMAKILAIALNKDIVVPTGWKLVKVEESF